MKVKDSPNTLNTKISSPRHVIIRLSNIKDRVFKTARDKRSIKYKGVLIRQSVDLSAESLLARKEWKDIFKTLKEKKLIESPEKLSFR